MLFLMKKKTVVTITLDISEHLKHNGSTQGDKMVKRAKYCPKP